MFRDDRQSHRMRAEALEALSTEQAAEIAELRSALAARGRADPLRVRVKHLENDAAEARGRHEAARARDADEIHRLSSALRAAEKENARLAKALDDSLRSTAAPSAPSHELLRIEIRQLKTALAEARRDGEKRGAPTTASAAAVASELTAVIGAAFLAAIAIALLVVLSR